MTVATHSEHYLLEILACPYCHGSLDVEGGAATSDAYPQNAFRCQAPSCGVRFPHVGGVPILLNEDKSLFDTETFLERKPTFFKPMGQLRQLISAHLPTCDANLAAKRVLRRMRELLLAQHQRPRILVLGGGVLGDGVEQLIDDPRIELVETDVSLADRTRVVCDGHDLPFQDGVFDGVIVQAVLEHVLDPWRCVEEIERVLKPTGLVYADTPFMQQVHGREYDFTRFTRLGHRRLFQNFTELESGITVGPGAALAWSLRYFFLSFCGSVPTRRVVGGLSRIAFSWLKYFDYFLAHRPGALDAASAFYFLGRRSPVPLDDRTLLADYHGGF